MINAHVQAGQQNGGARGRRVPCHDFPCPQLGCVLLALSDHRDSKLTPRKIIQVEREFKEKKHTRWTVSPSAFPLQQSHYATLISFSGNLDSFLFSAISHF